MELKWRGTDNQVTFGAKNSGDSLVLTSGDGVTALTFDSSQIATFANTPVVGTMTSSDNSTKAASTAYVTTAVAAAGGGDVSKVGTPVDNQLAVWTGANTIEGSANLTYDGTDLKIVGGTDNANIYLETPGGGNTSTIFFGDAAASNAGYIKYDNNNQRMQFGIEASTKGTWNANGLGIGTTAPSMALHVNSSSYDVAEFSSSHSAGAKLILDADATGGTEFALQSTADGAGTGGGKLDFVNAGNSRMVLTAAGNVGIGTTAPQGESHIARGSSKAVVDSTNQAIQ